MVLPKLPSELQITKWFRSSRRQLKRYGHTIWRALRSPTSLVRHSMANRSTKETEEPIAPIPFALLTLVFASLFEGLVVVIVGVNKPFFEDIAYNRHFQLYQHWATSLQKAIPVWFISASILICSLKFAIIIAVVAFWARRLSRSRGKYWIDVRALTYLLPIALIADICEYCAVNLSFLIFGKHVLRFVIADLIIAILSAFIVYTIMLRVVNQIYFLRGWRHVLHITGYVMVVPILIIALNLAFYMIPVGFFAIDVISPIVEGENKLDKGDYESAEKLFLQAIKNDATGVFSCGAHIRLVSVNARRILAILPNLSGDSGMRERLLHEFAQTEPFRKVINVWPSEGPINVSPTQLVELRDKILDSFLTSGDVPVTNSELDCATRSTAAEEGCDELPKEAVVRYSNTPVQRQQLYFLIFRARALEGEPTVGDARRYLQFLAELPIRIELMFVRYRALNLMRESETLANLDDEDRYGRLDRDTLINGNMLILNQGYKYPHLNIPKVEIEKLSDQEFGFYLRQVYLNYLLTEVRLLKTSRVSGESNLIMRQATLIEEQLNAVANDAMYLNIPKTNIIDKALLELLGSDSVIVDTAKSQ